MFPQSATNEFNASLTVPVNHLRTIEEFSNRKELLYALADAIAQNGRDWMTSGAVHGHIHPRMIRIGNMFGPPGTRGWLIRTIYITSPIAFKSVMMVKAGVDGKRRVTLDYVDDLESFYYVLAYICTTFAGPRTRLPTSTIPSPVKLIWSIGENASLCIKSSKTYLMEKETNLMFPMYGKPGGGYVTPYFSRNRYMETLLENLHGHLRYRYLRKVWSPEVDAKPTGLNSEELRALMREEAKHDYLLFKLYIDHTIALLEAGDDDDRRV